VDHAPGVAPRAAPRLALQAGLVALGLGVVAIPPLVIGLSGTASADVLWTALRLAALEAFTLISASIVLSVFRPLLNRVLKPRTVQRLHMTAGLAGFSLALSHGIMALIFGLSGYSPVPARVGRIVLVVLVVMIATALARRRLRHAWRWIHRLNYLLFAAILVHGLFLGYDLRNGLFLEICFAVYAAVVGAGLAYRLRVSLTATRRHRQPTGGQ
jgi:DMSO/TMAO reductase YedYZ heme-binding membrane subunit